MIHGTVNFAGNVATDVMTSAKMNLAFNDTRRIKAMKSDIKLFFDELQKITNSIMENNSFKTFEAILIKDSKKAEKKIESLSELEEKDDNYTKRILESLALDPSLRFIYELIVDKFGDKDNKVSNFAKKFDINIDEWKVKRLKEQLKKNKETNLYDENRILIAIDKVKAECAFWGIPFNEYTKELEELWTSTNTLLCNVDGNQFEIREDAECAKEDLRYFMEYSLKNNILDKNIEDVIIEIEKNIKSDYYKENLYNKIKELQEEQDLKNIQVVTERIISRMPIFSKIEKEFDYGHVFSHKVAYERVQNLMVKNEKVAFSFLTSLFRNGKNAILITSERIYLLKKDDIKVIDLLDYESIGIKDEKVYIKYNGEEYDTGQEILGLKQNEYYFLFETIERVIKMCLAIKNKDTYLADEDVYNNIIIRSKQKEYIRHNKLKVFIIGGILFLYIY